MTQIRIEPVPNPRPAQFAPELGFGRYFTNRMFTQRYSADKGWHDPVIGPFRPIEFDPAAQVLHCGQDVFEGTKAYPRPDGLVNLFRIDRNMARLNRALLLKYSETATLDPYSVSGAVSMALFEELVATASVVGQP